MSKTVVILNAPPYSGKDTIADIMVLGLKASKQEFKQALYEETANYYNWDLTTFIEAARDPLIKDSLFSGFYLTHQLSVRQALIHVSEVVVKPNKGLNYFGIKAAEQLKEGLNVFADGGGWVEELMPVYRQADTTIICRLFRHGFNFEKDSRNY